MVKIVQFKPFSTHVPVSFVDPYVVVVDSVIVLGVINTADG
jgi:hypothetical protein